MTYQDIANTEISSALDGLLISPLIDLIKSYHVIVRPNQTVLLLNPLRDYAQFSRKLSDGLETDDCPGWTRWVLPYFYTLRTVYCIHNALDHQIIVTNEDGISLLTIEPKSKLNIWHNGRYWSDRLN